MSITTVGTTLEESELKSRIAAFRNHEATLNKQDISAAEAEAEKSGSNSQTLLKNLQDNFDTVDLNGDGGISLTELQTYASNGKLTSTLSQQLVAQSSDADLLDYLKKEDERDKTNKYAPLSSLVETMKQSYLSAELNSEHVEATKEKITA